MTVPPIKFGEGGLRFGNGDFFRYDDAGPSSLAYFGSMTRYEYEIGQPCEQLRIT